MIERKLILPLWLISVTLAFALIMLLPSETQAQCALCRTGLQDNMTAKTINTAIIVLLIPPVAIFCSIFGIAYKKFKDDENENSDS